MKKTISLGKCAICSSRKVNEVTVDIEWENGNLSICASVWNQSKSDILTGGQCLEEIHQKIPGNKLFNKIYRLWKNYHLNDMSAGTKRQNEALADYPDICDYYKACDFLEERGLLTVPLEDCDILEGHKPGELFTYGHGWIKHEIPEADIKEIESFFE